MDAEFWHERWQRREIGFHKDQVHPFLPRFFPQLQLPKGSRVLVPLCGKSLDMLWLCEQGVVVVGVELSRMAIEEFFRKSRLAFGRSEVEGYSLYQSDQLQIYCGDFFALDPQQAGAFEAIYDRASLVALPPAMRPGYAAQLRQFLSPGGRMLTISYDYPQQQMPGPPFSVPEAELKELFDSHCRITKLYGEAALGMHKKMQQAGLTALQEEAYLLQPL